MSTHPLIINFVPDPMPVDPIWLTMIPEEYDNKATVEDVQEVLDTLFDTSPCRKDATSGEVEVSPAALVAAVVAINPGICAAILSGDYVNKCRVIRSHPDQPYKLTPSVGTLGATVRVTEVVTLTVSVIDAESVVLDYPVISDQRASWMAGGGPVLRANGNTLYWSGRHTGTIRTSYTTRYDVVSVMVPGLPKKPGADSRERGEKQGCELLAFYQDLAWLAAITPPPDDPAANDEYLAAVCGWPLAGGSSTVGEEEEEQPLPEEPPPPVDPCLNPNEQLADPEYYEDKCCHYPPPDRGPLPECQELRVGPVQAKGLSDEVKAKIAGMSQYCYLGLCHNVGEVEFIAVGPDPADPKGCGDIIHRIKVAPENCCDGVEPLVEHPDNPNEISSNGRVKMCVLGGTLPIKWEVSGGLWFDNGSTAMHTYANCAWVNSPKDFCERSVINVEDDCSQVSMDLHKPDAVPLVLCDEEHQDIVLAPLGYIAFQPTGGVPPYTGWQSDKLISIGDGGLFQAPPDFCGVATVRVMDSCMEPAECVVRSTAGQWANVDLAGDHCSGYSSAGGIPQGSGWQTLAQMAEFRISTLSKVISVADGIPAHCSPGNDLGSLERVCRDVVYGVAGGSLLDGGICRYYGSGGSYQDTVIEEVISSVEQWTC